MFLCDGLRHVYNRISEDSPLWIFQQSHIRETKNLSRDFVKSHFEIVYKNIFIATLQKEEWQTIFLSHFVYCGSPLHYKYNFMCWDTCRACSLIICTAKDTSSDKHKRRNVLCCALHEEGWINQKLAERFLLLVPFAIPDVISRNHINGMHSFTHITFYNIHFTRKILPARTAPTLQ